MQDVFITKIHIRKVRHLQGIDIVLSDNERKQPPNGRKCANFSNGLIKYRVRRLLALHSSCLKGDAEIVRDDPKLSMILADTLA